MAFDVGAVYPSVNNVMLNGLEHVQMRVHVPICHRSLVGIWLYVVSNGYRQLHAQYDKMVKDSVMGNLVAAF